MLEVRGHKHSPTNRLDPNFPGSESRVYDRVRSWESTVVIRFQDFEKTAFQMEEKKRGRERAGTNQGDIIANREKNTSSRRKKREREEEKKDEKRRGGRERVELGKREFFTKRKDTPKQKSESKLPLRVILSNYTFVLPLIAFCSFELIVNAKATHSLGK